MKVESFADYSNALLQAVRQEVQNETFAPTEIILSIHTLSRHFADQNFMKNIRIYTHLKHKHRILLVS